MQVWEKVKALALKHPFVVVLCAAIVVRLIAVIWSRGFIHSDDHFDSISVAWSWMQDGWWGSDGNLRWKHELADTIGRFPLYTLSLAVMMKGLKALGVQSLDSMMYAVRGVHALISLIPVFVAYRLTERITRSKEWALIAGLAFALHFALPFLGVRNLIEVVGGNIWMLAIYYLYRYREFDNPGALVWAGLFTGLAWMMRFQLAFAVLPIPFVLWYENKSLGGSVLYSFSVGAMLLLSGLMDWMLLGRFAGSTLTNLTNNTGLGALYNTIPALYPILLILLLVPPISIWLLWNSFRPSFVKDHRVLFFSSVAFVFFHWLLENQQERFIFPVLPAFLLLGILAVWWKWRRDGYLVGSRRLSRMLVGVSVVINIALLVFFTPAYGHKGMIEPMIWLKQQNMTRHAMFFQPDVRRWPPLEYADLHLPRANVREWDRLRKLEPRRQNPDYYDYIVIWPKRMSDLQRHVDSVEAVIGPIRKVKEFRSSGYDWLLHSLNPKHNACFQAEVYEPVRDGQQKAAGTEVPTARTDD